MNTTLINALIEPYLNNLLDGRKIFTIRTVLIMVILPFLLGVFIKFLTFFVLFYYAFFSGLLLYLVSIKRKNKLVNLDFSDVKKEEKPINQLVSQLIDSNQ